MSLDVSTVHALQGGQTVQMVAKDSQVAKAKAVDVMKTEPPISMEAILGELASVSAAFDKRLSFSFNEKIDQVVVKVIDTDTDKVIREIPPAELQHVHERIREVIGILFDERA